MALRKHKVRLGSSSIDDTLSPGWKRADLDHCGIIGRHVHNNLLVIDDLLPVFVD